LIGGILQSFGRNENLSQDFIGFQRGFALRFFLRRLKEFRGVDFSRLALGSRGRDGGIQGNQDWAETGGADELRRSGVSKNGVIAIVPARDERGLAIFAKQPEAVAEIPATRALAQIA